MKRNEKILAGGLALVVVGYFGWPMIHGIYLAPIERLDGEVRNLEQIVRRKEDENFQVRLAANKLADFKRRGLPGDELDAHRLYQGWLNDLAVASGLNPKVTPLRISRAGGVYSAVQVQLDGQATFGQLQTFLRRFQSVDLLHRVVAFDAESPSAEGDPPLKYTLTAEGITLDGAARRGHVFPQIELKQPLAAKATELSVPAKEFAARPGDMLRIGTEFAAIEKVDGDVLHLARSADGTAAEHAAGTVVELFPLRRVDSKPTAAVAALPAKIDSPFAKPKKYDPRLDGLADQKIVRGQALNTTVKVADYDASAGAATLELADAPKGLTFDPATGAVSWTPPADLADGDYKVSFVADVPAPKKRLEKTITLALTDPNTPPVFEPVATAGVFLGESVRLPLKAADPHQITFKLEQGPPGASVDPSSGEFSWTVPKSTNPGDVTVTVAAVDQGEPPQTTRQTFTITVNENIRPFVKLAASIKQELDGGEEWQAWIYDQTSNRRLTLRVGEAFKAAGVTGVIREIQPQFITYTNEGEIWRLGVGDSLEDIEKVGADPVATMKQEAAPPVEAEQPADPNRPAASPPASAASDRPSAS